MTSSIHIALLKKQNKDPSYFPFRNNTKIKDPISLSSHPPLNLFKMTKMQPTIYGNCATETSFLSSI